MKTISIDLRKRIVNSYDNKEGTKQQLAKRYAVSYGFVKKLIYQRSKIGTIEPLPRLGSKPKFDAQLLKELDLFVENWPDATLEQIYSNFQDKVTCTIPTIFNTLARLGYRYKKNDTRQRTRKK